MKIVQRKKYNHDIYKKISHAQRVQMIYDYKLHGKSIKQLVTETGIKYNTIRNIVLCYEETGRTNKKSFILSSKNKLNQKPAAKKQAQNDSSQLASISTTSGTSSPSFKSRTQVMFTQPITHQKKAGLKNVSKSINASNEQGAKFMTPLTADERAASSRCTLRLLTDHLVSSGSAGAEPVQSIEGYKIEKCKDSDFYGCVDAEIIPFNIMSYEKEKETPFNLFCGPLEQLNQVLRNEGVPLSQQQPLLRQKISSTIAPLQ